jgi:hypothetical protein
MISAGASLVLIDHVCRCALAARPHQLRCEYIMIRSGAVAAIPLHFYSFHLGSDHILIRTGAVAAIPLRFGSSHRRFVIMVCTQEAGATVAHGLHVSSLESLIRSAAPGEVRPSWRQF